VLSANELKHQVRKLWDFDRPYRHPGVELGTSTQIGISLGVALAHRDKKRIVVNIQPDGDLMFDAGALWVAAKYQIPMLIVMHNNRAYYNDWGIRSAWPSCAAPTRPRRISAWTCSARSRISPASRNRWAATAKARSTIRRT